MRNRVGLSTAFGSLLLGVLATPAAALQGQGAQPAGPRTQQPDEIIVTHQAWPRDAFADFVEDVTVDVNGQIAMFRAPICPFVDGFVDTQNAQIEQRMREVAKTVGLEVAQGKCSPNLVLMVANNGAATLRKLAADKPILFQGILPSEVRGLLHKKGPVWTWQTIMESASDGRSGPSSYDYKTGSGGVQGAGASSSRFEENASARRITSQSRVLKTTRPDLFASFMLIDFAAIEGLTPTQIADYAAIRTLARTQPGSTLRQRTMLRLLDLPRDRRPELDQLTPWDLAYLQALYKSTNTVSASLQKSTITAEMRRRFAPGRTVPPAVRPHGAEN